MRGEVERTRKGEKKKNKGGKLNGKNMREKERGMTEWKRRGWKNEVRGGCAFALGV